MSKIRLAVVGGGANSAAGRAHFAASGMAGFEWTIGCFSSKGIGENALNPYGCAAVASWRALLTVDRPFDAVLILTPTPMHVETVQAFTEQKIPVICEKSLGVSSLELQSVVPQAYLAVVYNYSGYPMVRELRRFMQDNIFGKILHVEADMEQEGYVRTSADPQAWRRQDGPVPMVHLDLGVHLHQLVWYLTGKEPGDVFAHQASYGKFDVIDNVLALACYSDGMNVSFRFGKASLGQRNGLRIAIYGDRGSATWVQSDPENLHLAFADGTRIVLDRGSSQCKVANQQRYGWFKAGHPAGFVEALANWYVDVADELRNGHQTGGTGEVFGWTVANEGLRLMEAMVESARRKQWITM